MAVPFANLIPQRSRVLPQGGAVLGQLTGTFQAGLEQGRMRAAEEQAPDLLLNYLDTQGQGYGGGTLGNLAAPATGYVGGQQAQRDPAMTPGSPTFNGGTAMRQARQDADAGIPQPPPVSADYAASIAGYGSGLNTTGLDAQFGTGLNSAIQAYIAAGGNPADVQINSLVRSTEEQQRLYEQYQRGEIGLAAPPGQSRHEYGAAADIRSGPFLDWLHQNAGQYGLGFLRGNAFTNDPGHVQLAGPSPAGTRAPAIPAGAGGMPATGGGYSSQPAWSPPTGAERAQLRALMINPATRQMGYQLAVQRMTPPEPVQPNYGFTEVGGVLYRTDPTTGQATPVTGAPPQEPGFRLATEQERAAAGYAAGDPPLQIGPDGRFYEIGSGGTRVEVNLPGQPMIGTIPQGWQATEVEGGGYTMNPVPGGPADREIIEAQQAREINAAYGRRQTDTLLTALSAAEEIVQRNPGQTTGWGQLLANLPASEARTLNSLLDTAKAIVGFETLQAMRDASPTGGALGAITERELAFLQSVQGSLDQGLSSDILLRNIQAIAASVERWNQAVQAARGPTGAGVPATGGDPVQVRTPADWEALAPGTLYIDPEGVERVRQ